MIINLTDFYQCFCQTAFWYVIAVMRVQSAITKKLMDCWPLEHCFIAVTISRLFTTLRPRHGRHFPDDIFKCIFLNENVSISIKIWLKFVPKGPINTFPALVQIMAWHRAGYKPLSEPMMVSLLTHLCVTRPQWVNIIHMTVKS